MSRKQVWLAPAVAGGLAGIANGFFGGGGGMVLVPLLTARCGLDQRRAFATSVAIILPLCVLSSVIYLFRGGLDLAVALPIWPAGWPVAFWADGCFKS
ncbi:MAG: TSUP family transporter [Intestinimonas sp.]